MTAPFSLAELQQAASGLLPYATLVGGIWALWQWQVSRGDRSTEVLLQLKEISERPKYTWGRDLLDENLDNYKLVRMALLRASLPEYSRETPLTAADREWLDRIDELLNFYVLLVGVRRAKQTRDAALAASFRYYLGHYFHPRRREFRMYVDRYFPTLRKWLRAEDAKMFNDSRNFFTPREFGWRRLRIPAHEVPKYLTGRVLILTGSGLSSDSGIPTFWGPDGYYEGQKVEDLASLAGLKRDPARVWAWYNMRRKRIREVQPNEGHRAIEWIGERLRDYLVVTQNVDDLHERAGTPAEKLVHIHGEIFQTKCVDCGESDAAKDTDNETARCPCGGLLRPGVVFFGEDLDPREVRRVERWIAADRCNAVLVIGTAARFDYISDWAIRAAGDEGVIIEINPHETFLSPAADVCIRKRAAAALPYLLPPLKDK